MVDATISCARLRDPACLGRSRLTQADGAGLHKPSASHRRPATDAASIATRPSTRPRQASSRPGSDDLVASATCSRRGGAGSPAGPGGGEGGGGGGRERGRGGEPGLRGVRRRWLRRDDLDHPVLGLKAVNAASTEAVSVTSHLARNRPSAAGRAVGAAGDLVTLGGERPRDREADAAVATGHEHGSGHGGEPYSPAMRGIQITGFGGPDVLEAVELLQEPQPAPGMRVCTTGISSGLAPLRMRPT